MFCVWGYNEPVAVLQHSSQTQWIHRNWIIECLTYPLSVFRYVSRQRAEIFARFMGLFGWFMLHHLHIPLITAGTVCSHSYAQCVYTHPEKSDEDMPPRTVWIYKYVWARLAFLVRGHHSFILPVFLAPSFSLLLHLLRSHSLFFFCLSLGEFVLTDADCTRHQLRWSEEEQHAAQSATGPGRKAGKATCK